LSISEEIWQVESIALIPPDQLATRASVNATQTPVSQEFLHALVLRQAYQRPDQIAVVTPTRRLCYAEVLNGAWQLAHWLGHQGARPNHLVAIVMEKGWEQIVAVLGVLLSGAAYLPLDPHLPQERLDYLLQHSEVSLVLTQSHIDARISWSPSLGRFLVDGLTLSHELPEYSCVQHPEDLAYVIYTSGSTGLPKGVMIDHRAAVNTILDINTRFAVTEQDRVLALSAFNFDLSVYDLFGLLAAGGAVVLPGEEDTRNPQAWLQLVQQERVTLWNSVPALMQMLIEYVETQGQSLDSSALRLVLLSGDWIPLTLPTRLWRQKAELEVISLGGATEAAIWSIQYPIKQTEPTWSSIPYGTPLHNQSFQILNERMEPTPVWVPGQLYIEGVGLAKGYWKDEEKTAASFVQHPHSGERLYRTGDLGRYWPDGTIEFLGREDFQVKIQGHRIELGEIEATLIQHPRLQDALAAAVGDAHGEKRLVAYIISEDGSTIETNDVRHFLEERLPAYMIPTSFVQMEQFPLTANGKVDRAALPTPQAFVTKSVGTPRVTTPTTTKVLQIVADVLKVDQVDPSANLIELGVTSLDIFRMANALTSYFRTSLDLSHLLKLSTVNAIAEYFEKYAPEGISTVSSGTVVSEDTSALSDNSWEEGAI
jgi:amino acid adenylation domain-containing protein